MVWNYSSNHKTFSKTYFFRLLFFARVINDFHPDNIVHFAEQRAAPYSMKTQKRKVYSR